MPFTFTHASHCQNCPHGGCIEDLRKAPIRGRNTVFRLKQQVAINCTFDSLMPGTDLDPDPSRTFGDYLDQFRDNAKKAGSLLYGPDFKIADPAIAKVEGDVFELLEAGALWNAAVAWNGFMDAGTWRSLSFQCPEGAVATPTRKVAIVKLPRGYDATLLFKADVRASIQAHEASLTRRGMRLGLSSPDIVGVRLPHPLPVELDAFLNPIDDLSARSMTLLEGAHRLLEGRVEGAGFLLAIAVKRTTRSDRLYQPLFEANVLKYLIEVVLKGAAFRFYAHVNSFAGADVVGAYQAASLISLIRGGQPTRAVDSLYLAEKPRDTAQAILDDLPLFPL